MPKTLKIEIASAIILVGFFVAVVFHYVMNFYENAHYPLNTFLFNPDAQQFSDYFSDYIASKDLSPYSGAYTSVYFPAAYLFFYPFTFLGTKLGVWFYNTFFLMMMAGFCRYYLSCENRLSVIHPVENTIINFKNMFLFAFMTFPVLFAFERGNLESMVFIFLAGSLFFYDRKKYLLSAILLSFPISMKLYPAVFLVLFLSDKRFKEIFLCVFCASILTLFALLTFKGSFGFLFQGLFSNLNWFKWEYVSHNTGLVFETSYYSLLEIKHRIYHHIPWDKVVFPTRVGLRNYAIIMIGLFFLVSAHILFCEKIFWKKIALLVCAMLLFPYISFDYKLLHIYLPLFFFVNERSAKYSMDLIYTLIFSFLLIPKNYSLVYGQVSMAVIVNIFLLTVLMIFILLEKFSSTKIN